LTRIIGRKHAGPKANNQPKAEIGPGRSGRQVPAAGIRTTPRLGLRPKDCHRGIIPMTAGTRRAEGTT